MIRSIPRSCSVRRGVLRNFAKFTRKHICQAPFFKTCCRHKTCNFIKKRLRHTCFPLNFAKFIRTPFSQNTSGRLFLCDLLLLLSFFIKTLTVTYHVYTRYKLNLHQTMICYSICFPFEARTCVKKHCSRSTGPC